MDRLIPNNAPIVRHIKPGDYIKTQEKTEDGDLQEIIYEVTDVYHYMVRAMDLNHKKHRCFCFGDLIALGKEYQSEALEAMRTEKKKKLIADVKEPDKEEL